MLGVELTSHYLIPSAIITSKEPIIIKTVLGSCIAACFYDKKSGIGGMNHFMLPFWDGNGLATPKYGNIAMRKLLETMLRKGSNRNDLVAKIFGGADMFNLKSGMFSIGKKNIEVAISFLKEEHIPLISSDVEGNQGRKILFNTSSGEVFLQRIDSGKVKA